jgi:hypothetical protein
VNTAPTPRRSVTVTDDQITEAIATAAWGVRDDAQRAGVGDDLVVVFDVDAWDMRAGTRAGFTSWPGMPRRLVDAVASPPGPGATWCVLLSEHGSRIELLRVRR